MNVCHKLAILIGDRGERRYEVANFNWLFGVERNDNIVCPSAINTSYGLAGDLSLALLGSLRRCHRCHVGCGLSERDGNSGRRFSGDADGWPRTLAFAACPGGGGRDVERGGNDAYTSEREGRGGIAAKLRVMSDAG